METGEASPSAVDAHPPAPARAPTTSLLVWPPPGLERMQADLWTTTRRLAIGSTILVPPLLWAVAVRRAFWNLGPFGADWWILALTSGIGLIVLSSGLYALFRLFRRAGLAADRGYGWVTIAQVAADASRDTGFAIIGARAYSTLSASARRTLLVSRLLYAGFALGVALWPALGLAIALLLSGRGFLSETGLWLLVLAPFALLLVAALSARTVERRLVARAKRLWFARSWSEDLAQNEVETWNRHLEMREYETVLGTGSAGLGRRFAWGAAAAALAAMLVILPTLALVGTSSIGTVIATTATPKFATVGQRFAAAEPLRRFVLEPDPSITPAAAGTALHVLASVGREEPASELLRPPARTYPEPWFPATGTEAPFHLPGADIGGLFTRAAAGFTPVERDFLARVAAHPAHAEFATVARAGAMDVLQARWTMPLPEETSLAELPLPRFSVLRQGAYAHIAKAAFELAEGRPADAEQSLREVVSVGFRMADDGPTLLDNLIGLVIVGAGGAALEDLWAAAGRQDEASTLAWVRSAAEQAARASEPLGAVDLESALQHMPAGVRDTRLARGLRWEQFLMMNTLAPCINANRMVFGPDPALEQWRREAEQALVRFDSERQLFELARYGYGGPTAQSRPGLLAGLLALPLRDPGVTGSCAGLVRGILN